MKANNRITPDLLKRFLLNLKKNDDVSENDDELQIINKALIALQQKEDFSKITAKLNQAINLYSLSHNFQLTKSLTQLKILLNENADKWKGAGITFAV